MKRPSLTFDIKVGAEKRTIKWTYGMSQDIQRLVPDFGTVITDIVGDPIIRDYLTRRCLTEQRGSVKEESELISMDELDDLDPEQVIKLLDWVSEHLLYFFANSAGNMSRQAKEFGNVLEQLSPSTTGSVDSASPTPSAGPSE